MKYCRGTLFPTNFLGQKPAPTTGPTKHQKRKTLRRSAGRVGEWCRLGVYRGEIGSVAVRVRVAWSVAHVGDRPTAKMCVQDCSGVLPFVCLIPQSCRMGGHGTDDKPGDWEVQSSLLPHGSVVACACVWASRGRVFAWLLGFYWSDWFPEKRWVSGRRSCRADRSVRGLVPCCCGTGLAVLEPLHGVCWLRR